MSSAPPLSLRERKKTETWNAIHDAAAELALAAEPGDAPVTAEAIAGEAGISPRTFFNYFPTKEDAILGVRACQKAPDLPEGFLDDDDLLGRTTALLLSVGRSAYADGDADRRALLFARYPHLLLRRRELTLQGEDLVHRALAAAMAEHPEWSQGVNGRSVENTARMLTMAAGVPLRYSVMSAGGVVGGTLSQDAVEDAIGLFRDLYQRLT